MTKATSKPVLVTTEFRGVFFGYVKEEDNLPAEITLTAARNCIYWAASVGGLTVVCMALRLFPRFDCLRGSTGVTPACQ